ncbi:MAG: ribbon-helix-helix domain-containing protein [Planctomycetota bacterium]|nr:ribbon-helix-helix domain-containing protein [Planctomycetota bacterium]
MYKACMVTINVSLPEKLKKDAEELVKAGEYVSFSDLVRDSLRNSLERNELDRLYEEAKRDERTGRATVLKSKKDIDNYFKKL